MHCLGLTSRQVAAYLQEVLQAFSQKYREVLGKFAAQVELDPQTCPFEPAPYSLNDFWREIPPFELEVKSLLH